MKGTLHVRLNTAGSPVNESIVIPLTGGGTRTVTVAFNDAVTFEVGGTLGLVVFDFVYVSGEFHFTEGAVEKVDVHTGLSSIQAATTLLGVSTASSDPSDGSLAQSSDGSLLWNLPVATMDFGLSGVDVFVGYAN